MVYWEIRHTIHNQSSGWRKSKGFQRALWQPKEKAPDSFKKDAKRCLERIWMWTNLERKAYVRSQGSSTHQGRARGKCTYKSWEVRELMTCSGICRTFAVAGWQVCPGILRLAGKEQNRGRLQKIIEQRESETRSTSLLCPIKKFHQSRVCWVLNVAPTLLCSYSTFWLILCLAKVSFDLDSCSSGWAWFMLIHESVRVPDICFLWEISQGIKTKVKSISPKPGIALHSHLTKELQICQSLEQKTEDLDPPIHFKAEWSFPKSTKLLRYRIEPPQERSVFVRSKKSQRDRFRLLT